MKNDLYLIANRCSADLRAVFEQIEPQERIEIIENLLNGYCEFCGVRDPSCRCWDDE